MTTPLQSVSLGVLCCITNVHYEYWIASHPSQSQPGITMDGKQIYSVSHFPPKQHLSPVTVKGKLKQTT